LSAGGVVINPLGNILLIDQGTSWSLPKGHLHKNENPLAAAKREIFEESGIADLILIKDLGSYNRVQENHVHVN
jgi:ADP-ribose pyrophosphatase YjhB (NUDIX family)